MKVSSMHASGVMQKVLSSSTRGWAEAFPTQDTRSVREHQPSVIQILPQFVAIWIAVKCVAKLQKAKEAGCHACVVNIKSYRTYVVYSR